MLSGAPVYVGSTAEARQRFPAMFRVPSTLTQHAWAAVPLRAGGVVIGALGVGFGQERDFPPAERRFLETVADQCALAVERARLYSTAATERERLAAVLARLPAGVVIGEAPTGRLVLGNAEVERIWGQPFQAGIGFDQYGTYRGFHPDGRPYEAEEWPLARSLTRGEVVIGEEVDVERGDGTRGTIVANSAPIHDADGTVTRPRSARSSTSPTGPRPGAGWTRRTRPSGRPGPRPRRPASGSAGCSRSPRGWPRR